MNNIVIIAAFLVIAVIHLLPVVGVSGAGALKTLYGSEIVDPSLELLMRHRAVLFGILGVFFSAAAFLPFLRMAALLAGFASVVSFLVLAWMTGGYGGEIHRVVVADYIALVALLVAGAAMWMS